MSTIAEMIESVKRIDALLADDDLEPRAERDDWPSARKKIDALKAALTDELAPLYQSALEETDGTEIRHMIQRRTAHLYAEAAAVLQASGDSLRAAEYLTKAERMTPDPEHKTELVAAQREPAVYARLLLARWFLNEGRFADADREAKRVRKETKQPPIADKAKKILDSPRPLTGGPPSLFTLNGFGTGLYGSRDTDSEGSYVATYCICFLFIPVFPLAAYRVKRVDSRTYRFFAKEKLSGFARGFQAFVGLAAAFAIGGAYINSYLESPERRARIALEEARAVEASGDSEKALESYRKIVDQFGTNTSGVKGATEAIARIAAQGVPAPCNADSVEPARRAANAFVSLPDSAKDDSAGSPLTKRLEACAAEIGDADADKARAALRILDLASDVAIDGPDKASIKDKRAAARRTFAVKMAASRPVLALAELGKLSDPESVAAAQKILADLEKAPAFPSLWVEARADIERWLKSAREVNQDAAAQSVRDKLGKAVAMSEASEKLIDAGDAKLIEKAAAEHPEDQELTVAVASARRAAGDAKAALAMLTKLGAPGQLTSRAQQLTATLHGDTGDLAKADEILTALVDERLPPFQDAQRAYLSKADEVENKIIADLRLGIAPPDLERQLKSAFDDVKKRELIRTWISDKIAADPTLASARAEYLLRGSAVPASLSLGTIKLRRAQEAHGDDRKRLLDQAERAFLAIRNEASGDPSFHLGLGQVYFRLGKTDEGEKEFQGVLERDQPLLSLAVANVYRELGLYARARAVAKKTYESAPDESSRHDAASLLAHLATDLEDEEAWLRKSDTMEPSVRVGLDRVAGSRLLRAGKNAEADAQFKKCVEFFDRTAKISAVSANNAATETMRRYEATGDPAHLKTAAAYLETAARLDPENALITGNLSAALVQLGQVTVLEKFVETRPLALDLYELADVLDSITDGPLSAEILEALRKDPAYQRALETSQKHQVLAPQAGGAYRNHIQWLRWSHDTKALEDLAKRVSDLPATGDSNSDFREKWLSGERDEITLRERKDAVVTARQRVQRTRSSSKPTQAVAWNQLASALASLTLFEHDAAQLDEMVDAARKAQAAWPEGITANETSYALFTAAFFHAVDATPSLKKLWDDERRKHTLLLIAYNAVTAAPDLAAAIRKDPALAEAASVRKQSLREPTLTDFLVARIAGSADLEQAASKVFDRHDVEVAYVISSKLDPADEDTKQYIALFKSRGAAAH